MPNPFLVVTALGLAVGLAACDQGAQEQAQTPNREQEQQQQVPPAEQAPATPPAEQQQPPAANPSGGSGSGQQ